MSDTTIEWATRVWNVTRGCRRVSAGCGTGNEGGCYAERQAFRFRGPGQPYEGLVEMSKHGPRWTGKGRFVYEKLAEPLHVRSPKDGTRHRFFVDSMSDLFYDEFTNEQIAAVFGVMAACPQHDFLILTKRAERLPRWFEWARRQADITHAHVAPEQRLHWFLLFHARQICMVEDHSEAGWPLPNVWLGVSAEDQASADERIPHLLATPAAVRFVSAEPLLGPIDLFGRDDDGGFGPGWHLKSVKNLTDYGTGVEYDVDAQIGLDWVIVGGESGPGARPLDIAWARSLVAQCRAAGVPVFCKQLGAQPRYDGVSRPGEAWPEGTKMDEYGEGLFDIRLRSTKGGDPNEWPPDLRVREFPAGPATP